MKNHRKNIFTVGLYNVENLFDTINNPNKNDNNYTPTGSLRWSRKRYYQKIKKIASVISQIGNSQCNLPPDILGLIEVENANVVNDLVNHPFLKKHNYNFVHFDSNDERGIDVALIYREAAFEKISSKIYHLPLKDAKGNEDHTRDILLVEGKLYGKLIYVLINHWPSRREGEEVSKPKRIKAAKLVQTIIDEIKLKTKNPKLLVMGDFNDNPTDESIEKHLVAHNLYNPMRKLDDAGLGTSTYYNEWHLFDQILFSKNFFETNSPFSFLNAKIFSKKWLRISKGKYKDSPFRTYIGRWYQGGYSDHFPVYLTFEKDK